jgi:hypothetical protein
MRYGEHVEETTARDDWVCPHCRDLCNCSFHRSRRGWAPTGTLFRRAAARGYASVAHFLVLNNLEPGARREALPMMPQELRAAVEAELAAEGGGAAVVGAAAGEAAGGAAPPPTPGAEGEDEPLAKRRRRAVEGAVVEAKAGLVAVPRRGLRGTAA